MKTLEDLPDPEGDELLGLNPTVYLLGDSYRYVRTQVQPSGKHHFFLTAISAERLHKLLFSSLLTSRLTVVALTGLIEQATGSSNQEARDYLLFLLEVQFLYSKRQGDVFETVTASRPDALQGTAPGFTFEGSARCISATTSSLEDTGLLSTQLPPLFPRFSASTPVPERGNYYGGLERLYLQGGLAAADHTALLTILPILRRLALPVKNSTLENFIAAFRDKFDRQKVPLLMALDPDAGVVYGSAGTPTTSGWLEGIPFEPPAGSQAQLGWAAVHQLFLQRWLHKKGRGPAEPITLSEEDVNALPLPDPGVAMPPTLSVLFSKSMEGMVLENVGGASATALPGRFSAFSQDAEDLCRRIAELEIAANPGVILADIGQSSDPHVDNVNRRRLFYDYYIPVNTWSNLPHGQALSIRDLVLSLQGNELILESVSMGKRVIPRLATAYNFHHNELGIFRLLCDLQYQNLQTHLTLDLERIFPGMNFYPRVVYQNIILSAAKWYFTREHIAYLTQRPLSLGRLHLFREEHGLPAWITLGSGDQQLCFHLSDDRHAAFFLSCIQTLDRLVIREYLLPDESVTDGRAPLSGQFLAFLATPLPVFRPVAWRIKKTRKNVTRRYLPGSEWLYLKIYCTPQMANRMLINVAKPVLHRYRTYIDTWFFIRYQDPSPHIRLRIHVQQGDLGKLLQELSKAFSAKQYQPFVREYHSDTYTRELERYSPELIEDVELLFSLGSQLVLAWLEAQAGENGTFPDHLFGMTVALAMGKAFLPETSELEMHFAATAENFRREFDSRNLLTRHLNDMFREIKPVLIPLLKDYKQGFFAEPAIDLAMGRMIDQMHRLSAATLFWTAGRRRGLLADLIHMQVNRIFEDSQRQHETLICHCLHKYLVYCRASAKKKGSKAGTTAGEG